MDRFNKVTAWINDYGPQIEPFIQPLKTYVDSGVQLTGQHFGGGARNPGSPSFRPPFFLPWQIITRKYDGKVWQPEERLDRVRAIKIYTSWAAKYVQKPDQLGSLERGKFADLLVIDRDYFTVPIDDILKIRPLMTMVGGKMIVLQESLAKDFGMQPVGPAYNFRDEDVRHVGESLSGIEEEFSSEEERMDQESRD